MNTNCLFQYLIGGSKLFSSLILISFFTVSITSISAQEICNNGIDDDGDSLIDINDDECLCSNLRPLTDIFGNPCTRIDLRFEYPNISTYQWYKDGVVLTGYTSEEIEIHKFNPLGDGIYQVYAESPNGCIASEPYEVKQDEYYTDLGESLVCEGDSIIVEGFTFFREGKQSLKTISSEGCDSTVCFRIRFIHIPELWINVNLCEGESFISPTGSIETSEPGLYEETFISYDGCDSTIVYDVAIVEKKTETIYQGICEGDTYEFGDIIATESGSYETVELNDQGCETNYIVDLIVDNVSCDENYLSGSVYYDENRNGIRDENENGVNSIPILVSNSISLIPDNSGRFWLFGDLGNTYTIELDEAKVEEQHLELTTLNSSYVIQNFSPGTSGNHSLDFGLIVGEPSVQGRLSSSPINTRCNTIQNHTLKFQNLGNPIIGDDFVEIKYNLDTFFRIDYSYPEPVLVEDGIYTYHFFSLEAYETVEIELEIENPDESFVGDYYKNTTTAFLNKDDVTTLLDEKTFQSFILCAYDPNDKLVSPVSEHDDNRTMLDQELTYTVRFQNTGNAVAHNVSIIDTLDQNLDLTTFTVLESSHAMSTQMNRNVVEFLFRNINLPDSISNEPQSHGYVTYSISPRKDVTNNTLITNKADIYFDANPPIRTNTTENLLVEETTSVSDHGLSPEKMISIYPNPVKVNHDLIIVNADTYTYQLSIVDRYGRIMMSSNILPGKNSITTNNLDAGVYFCVSEYGTHKETHKLVIHE